MTVEKIARYERGTKKVYLTVKEDLEILDGKEVVGHTINNHTQEYKPDYIHKIWKNLQAQKVVHEKALKDLKEKEEQTFEFSYDELLKMKRMQIEIGKMDALEKAKNEKDSINKSLETINNDIRILTATVKQLPPLTKPKTDVVSK